MPLFVATTIHGNSRFLQKHFVSKLLSHISMLCAVRLAFHADEGVKETSMACSFEIKNILRRVYVCSFHKQRQEEAKS